MRNFRYALRVLLKNPGFALVAVITLALGIGANTAIFSVADALLLRPLPYAHPERLVLVYAERADAAGAIQPFSFPRAIFLTEKSRAFSGLAAFTNENFNLTGRGDPEQLSAARVSWNFFDLLGVRPMRIIHRGPGKPMTSTAPAVALRRMGSHSLTPASIIHPLFRACAGVFRLV